MLRSFCWSSGQHIESQIVSKNESGDTAPAMCWQWPLSNYTQANCNWSSLPIFRSFSFLRAQAFCSILPNSTRGTANFGYRADCMLPILQQGSLASIWCHYRCSSSASLLGSPIQWDGWRLVQICLLSELTLFYARPTTSRATSEFSSRQSWTREIWPTCHLTSFLLLLRAISVGKISCLIKQAISVSL